MAQDITEAGKANPNDAGKADPAQQGNPGQGAESVDQLKLKLEEAQKKLDTVTRQYTGSSEEALRLKAEVDALKKAQSTPKDEAAFAKRIDEVGLAQAVRELVNGAVAPLIENGKKTVEREATAALQAFISKHPNLTGELLAKFDAKLKKLVPVYDNALEAMEDAYRAVGGEVVEAKPDAPAKQPDQSEEDRKKLAQGAGGADDKKSAPVDQKAGIKAEITRLEGIAMQKSVAGRDATEELVRIENLRKQLA